MWQDVMGQWVAFILGAWTRFWYFVVDRAFFLLAFRPGNVCCCLEPSSARGHRWRLPHMLSFVLCFVGTAFHSHGSVLQRGCC